MATKKKADIKTPAATPSKKVTPVADKPRTLAPHEIVLSPSCQNAISIDAWGKKFVGATDLADMVKDLREQIDKIKEGDMGSVEAMLYGQAMTLQTMFTSLVMLAASETGLKQYQAKLTFALKAQAQCRATLEALAEIKNPRPFQFVKQANMTTGPQQVNNAYAGTQSHSGMKSGAGNIQSEPNKLLEAEHGQWMDTGTQGATGRGNQAVETVESIHRS